MKQITVVLAIVVVGLLTYLYFYTPVQKPFKLPAEGFEERTCASNSECPRYFTCKERKCVDTRPKMN